MFISEKDIVARIASKDNLATQIGLRRADKENDNNNTIEFRRSNPSGRTEGAEGRDIDDRVLAGTLAQLMPAKEVADLLHISPRIVTANKAGESSPGVADPELRAKLSKEKEETITSKAADLLIQSLGKVGSELDESNTSGSIKRLRSLTGVSKDLADIHYKLSGNREKDKQKEDGGGTKVQIILYTPSMKKLEDYEVIEANT